MICDIYLESVDYLFVSLFIHVYTQQCRFVKAFYIDFKHLTFIHHFKQNVHVCLYVSTVIKSSS